MDLSNTSKRLVKFHEGWLDYRSNDNRNWISQWCVLKSNILFFFNSSDTREDTHIGTLTINSQSKLVKHRGDESTGYPFELHTKNRVNDFRTKKFYERELWRAFIEGVSKGSVPDNIDLPPGQVEQVQRILSQNPVFFQAPKITDEMRQLSRQSSGFDSPNCSDSGSFNLVLPVGNEEYLPPVDFIESDIRETPNSSRTQMYRFCSERAGNAVPSWFFFRCSREDAELLLTDNKKFGNTLMRVSSSGTQGLVISKRLESTRPVSFIHYRVLEHPEGYSLDVKNTHKPMGTLSDVMDFFVKTAGRASTVPLAANNLQNDLDKYHSHHEYGHVINNHFGRAQRSMSVPYIPKSQLPQNRLNDEPNPPPLPPNHPAQKGTPTISSHLSLRRPSCDGVQVLPRSPLHIPTQLQSPLSPNQKFPQLPTDLSPAISANTRLPTPPSPGPPPVAPPPPPPPPPQLPKAPTNTPTPQLPKAPTNTPTPQPQPKRSARLEALLLKDSQNATQSIQDSESTSPQSPERNTVQAKTDKPEPPKVAPKPDKKVPSVASPQFLELLNKQLGGASPAKPTPAPQQQQQDEDPEYMYENLEQYQS